MTPEGPICGRQAIQKKYADLFEQSHPTSMVCTVDWVNAVENVLWNSGEWTCTLQGGNGSLCIKGYRSDVLVREGDAWKESMSCYNMTPPSAPSCRDEVGGNSDDQLETRSNNAPATYPRRIGDRLRCAKHRQGRLTNAPISQNTGFSGQDTNYQRLTERNQCSKINGCLLQQSPG
jgi:hypothetical protein